MYMWTDLLLVLLMSTYLFSFYVRQFEQTLKIQNISTTNEISNKK